MKQSSIMQADRNAQPDVRQIMSGMSTAAATLSDDVTVASTTVVALAITPSSLTDAQLYRQCKHYGKQAKDWMRKFESLLPEVHRRRLYKRRGFAGIHEFAQKMAGMSRDKVDRILQLSEKLKDKPALQGVFENGEVGYATIARVAYVATEETDAEWANNVKTHSHIALNLMVEKVRQNNREDSVFKHRIEPEKMTSRHAGGELPETFYDPVEECAIADMSTSKVSFNMHVGTERKLRALQRELEKERGEKLSLGETIATLINREHENLIEKAQRKRTISYCPDCVQKRADEAAAKSEITRAVPAEIRHTVLTRQNHRCVGMHLDVVRAGDGSRDGDSGEVRAGDSNDGLCTHPPAELHHLDGWTLTKNHNPDRMRYLCKKHHAEMHAHDAQVQTYRSG